MTATAKNSIGWGSFPTGDGGRFERAAGVFRRLPVPRSLPSGRKTSMMQRQLSYEARLGRIPGDISMPLHMDNSASLANASNDNVHTSSRYTAIRIAIIRQAARDMVTRLTYVSTSKNISDAMTKPLTRRNMLVFYTAMYGAHAC
mmetsp:Transcript_33972/g.45908  ORF Transcript_33972/g.45908 Transcript_33972/m.45908 type:complete len:145 (+) Transcript_33972:590-1024(+)